MKLLSFKCIIPQLHIQSNHIHFPRHDVCHWLVGWLELNVPFQHKYGYIRDERSGVESYPYPVKEG